MISASEGLAPVRDEKIQGEIRRGKIAGRRGFGTSPKLDT